MNDLNISVTWHLVRFYISKIFRKTGVLGGKGRGEQEFHKLERYKKIWRLTYLNFKRFKTAPGGGVHRGGCTGGGLTGGLHRPYHV